MISKRALSFKSSYRFQLSFYQIYVNIKKNFFQRFALIWLFILIRSVKKTTLLLNPRLDISNRDILTNTENFIYQ